MSNLKISLKNHLFNTYVFVQLLYAVRELWWGISAGYFSFGLQKFDILTSRINATSLVALGMLGIIGALTKSITCNIIYSLLNVFLFAIIAFTFFMDAPGSSAGINYLIEMIGGIWLAYQVGSRRKRDIEFQRFIKENWSDDSVKE